MIYPVYSSTHDITFIMEDLCDDSGNVVSTEVIGFYYGEPDEQATELFRGSLKARFDL